MNANVMKACVLGIVLVMLGTVCVVAVPTDAQDAQAPVFQQIPTGGTWYNANSATDLVTENTYSNFSTITSIDEFKGIGISNEGGKYHILFKDANVSSFYGFNITGDVEVYVVGNNTVDVLHDCLINASGPMNIYVGSSSSIDVKVEYLDTSSGPTNVFNGVPVKVIGKGQNTSTLRFDCSGADQDRYCVALNGCDYVGDVRVEYRYNSEEITENPSKNVDPNGGIYTYANMCHKVFMQGYEGLSDNKDPYNTVITGSTMYVYGAYWALNIDNTVISNSYIDITACDVAISVKESMAVQNSTIITRTLWEKAWRDANGTDENLNHIAAGISIGSPGNGNDQNTSTLDIDEYSSVTTMGIRFYNNSVQNDPNTPNLTNNGNLIINESSFGGYENGSFAGYGVMASFVPKEGNSAKLSDFSFVNNGDLAVNAPFYVNAITGEGTQTTATSSFTNTARMYLNSDFIVELGSDANNTGTIIYTENATGLDDFTTNTGTIQQYQPDVPSVPSDDDESLPPFIPQQPTGSDDTTLYIACCAAAAVVALLAIIIVMNERKR